MTVAGASDTVEEARALAADLADRGVRLWRDGDALRFSAPAGVLDDAQKQRLRALKPALMDLLAHEPHAAGVPNAPTAGLHQGGPAPLSDGQRRMWLAWCRTPSSAAYTIAFSIELDGPVDVAALERAVLALQRRHAVLRGRYVERGAEPVCVIDAEPTARLHPITDLCDFSLARAEAEAAAAMGRLAREPFDLAASPPFRAKLFRLAETRLSLFISLHHIVADTASVTLIYTELAALYHAETGGPEAAEPARLSYADYAVWRRKRLESAEGRKAIEAAADALRPAPDAFSPPPVDPQAGEGAGRTSFTIGAETTRALEALAARTRSSLFMIWVAALRALLHRYSGQPDVLICAPALTRDHPELEGVLGYFGDTLLFRARVSRDDRLEEVLVRERDAALQALQHREAPFERVQEALAGDGVDLSALARVMVSFGSGFAPPQWPGPVTARLKEARTGEAKLDLMVWVNHADTGMDVVVEYDTARFDPPLMRRFAAHLSEAVKTLASRPEARVADLARADAPAPARISAGEPRHVIERVFAQAERSPDSIALRHRDGAMSYAALAAASSAAAGALIHAGVQPGERVAVLTARTPRLVATLLGAWRCGAAVVPLDPRQPDARLAAMVRTSRPALIAADNAHAARAARLHPNVVRMDEHHAAAPLSAVRKSPLALVLHTSGSTGTPKGVLVPHAGLAALMDWSERTYDTADLAGVLAASSIGFDLSMFELLAPLVRGGAAVLADTALDLPGHPDRDAVTLINTAPSVMAALLDAWRGPWPSSLRVVNLAGERLSAALADAVYARTGASTVYDLYGPTEDTTYSLFARRTRGGAERIGRPLPGTRAYVLGPDGGLAPKGALGELLLAGDGLAWGYDADPAMTALRFAPPADPAIPESRVYRTGDLVRMCEDGAFAFAGRLDDQVKVRGHRIEPAEIEAALKRQPKVINAAARALSLDGGEPRLDAFVVADAPLDLDRVRDALAEALPGWMIPDTLTQIDALPLTLNGKIDRARLPSPAAAASDAGSEPRPGVEAEIAKAWRDVLPGAVIGRRTSFFEAGGHSLSAMRAAARITDRLGVELPLRAFFESPRLEGLSRQVEALRSATAAPAQGPRARGDRPGELSAVQAHLWMLHYAQPDAALMNLSTERVYQNDFDPDSAKAALRALVARHDILRAAFPPGLTVVQREAEAAPEIIDAADGGAQGELDAVYARARRAFDPMTGPCARFAVCREGAAGRVVFVLHHLIADEWSLKLLRDEFDALYEAARRGAPPPTPSRAEALTYADFAVWQNDRLKAGAFAEGCAAWRRRLAKPTRLDPPWRQGRSTRVHTRAVRIETDLSARLEQTAARRETSLFVVLLAGVKRYLAAAAQSADISVATNMAYRHRPELEPVIGPLTDTVVLRTRFAGEPPPAAAAAIDAVRETFLDACARLDAPFEAVAAELEAFDGVSRGDLAQTFFMLHTDGGEGDAGQDGFLKNAVHAYDLVVVVTATAGGELTGRVAWRGAARHGAAILDGLLASWRALAEAP